MKKRTAWNKGETKKCYALYCNNIIPIYRKYCSHKCYSLDKIGKPSWNKGKKDIYSYISLQKMSKSQKERFLYEPSPNKGKKLTEEHKQKFNRKGKSPTKEIREKISKSMQGNLVWNKGLTKETNIKLFNQSIVMKNKWNNPTFVKMVLESNQIKPNKAELSLQYTMNSLFFENQFQINVLGNFIIGGKIPDFIDKTNNKIIELYGDYWHKGQDPNDRINYFKDYGYNTLVIWEHELKDINDLKKKLMGFIYA